MAQANPPKQGKIPFYIQVTNVKEDFTNGAGEASSIDLPLVTLPAGTVLFRGLRIPNATKGEDARYFYRDFIGNPEANDKVCMPPTHNTFFYPFPYVAFGTHDIGKTFDMMQMVVLVHPVNVVCSISPSTWVRGQAQRYDGNAPYQRCSNFAGPNIDCHTPSDKEQKAKTYDNCLHPAYQVASGTRGWMALADLDSLNPGKLRKLGKLAKDSPMSTYIRGLEGKYPGLGSEAIAWTYTDDHRHAGYPEIALYPYKEHKGQKLLKRYCATDADAMRIIQKEAAKDNLLYLPIAAFTRTATVDMVGGFFNYERLGVSENAFGPTSDVQSAIEVRVREYMDKLQSSGLDLPFYGNAKLSFDTRTGFYVLPQIVPRNLKIPLDEGAGSNAKGVKEIKDIKDIKDIPYSFLLLPLSDAEARKRALLYMLLFRSVVPENFMKKYGLLKEFGVYRAMVFSRFPVVSKLFTDLELTIPPAFKAQLARAAALYQKETGILPAAAAQKKAAAEAAAPPPAESPKYIPATPTYGPTPPLTPTYAPTTPTYAPTTTQNEEFPQYAAITPRQPRTPNYPPPVGGKAKAKASRKSRKTLNLKSRSNKTKTRKSTNSFDFAKNFSSIWKTHAKNQYLRV